MNVLITGANRGFGLALVWQSVFRRNYKSGEFISLEGGSFTW